MFWFVTMTIPKKGLLFTLKDVHLLGDNHYSPNRLSLLHFELIEVKAVNNSG